VALGLTVHGLSRRQRVVAGAAVAAGALALVLVFPTAVGRRLLGTFAQEEAPWGLQASTIAHRELFFGGLRMIGDHPLWGVGVGNFSRYSLHYSDAGRHFIAHNSYVEIGAEVGLPGLATYLLFLVLLVRSLARSERWARDSGRDRLALGTRGIRMGVLAFLIPAFFISAEYEKLFWLFAFLSMCAESIARRVPEAAQVSRAAPAAGAVLLRTSR
jgi:O-antigen ligase